MEFHHVHRIVRRGGPTSSQKDNAHRSQSSHFQVFLSSRSYGCCSAHTYNAGRGTNCYVELGSLTSLTESLQSARITARLTDRCQREACLFKRLWICDNGESSSPSSCHGRA